MEDMEELIRRETARIPGIAERVAFKDLTEQVFLALYETNREMYRQLEQRVMDDLAFDLNRCRVCTGIVESEYFDKTHHFLSPMKGEDTLAEICRAETVFQKLREQGKYRVMTLFLECDYLKVKSFLTKKRVCAIIKTSEGDYETNLLICQNREYLDEISHLYEVFLKNGIPWQTVNAPYIYKFVDLYLEEWPGEMPGEQIVIEEICPNLEELSGFAKTNCIPVWNIKKLELDSVGFPVPCEDHKSFEHTISIRDYGSSHVYMIDDEERIYHVRQSQTRLRLMSEQDEACSWKIYMIRSGEQRKFERFTYPLMTNSRRDEFLERFHRRQGIAVKTEAELARFLRGFGLEAYVKYTGYEIKDRTDEGTETYCMNHFITDEIRDRTAQKKLVLYFSAGSEFSFLHRDIMSFLVSEVQLLYPEYTCEGRLM